MSPVLPIPLRILLLASGIVAGAVALLLAAFQASRLGDQRRTREAQALSLDFARYLVGGMDGPTLRRRVAAESGAVFWESLESFTDNVSGEEWHRLSAELRLMPEVRRERERLERGSELRRALAARHLGMLGAPRSRAALRAAMARGPDLVTLSAALALARVGDAAALGWLLAHPDATAARSRHQLLGLIKRFGPQRAPVLREWLRDHMPSRSIQFAAVEALGLWHDVASRARLEHTARTAALEGRIAAVRALGYLKEAAALGTLLEALGDHDWQVRAQAARALGELGAPDAVAPLSARLGDAVWWVRRNAAYSLLALGPGGHGALMAEVAAGNDRFAIEIAEEAIEAMAWDRESPGGISRVA